MTKLSNAQARLLEDASAVGYGASVYGSGRHRTAYSLVDVEFIVLRRYPGGTHAEITDAGRAALEAHRARKTGGGA